MTITLHAYAPGDMTVGIPNAHWTVEDVGPLDDYEGMREDVRKAFAAAFDTIAGSKARVWFSDEQPTG
ncbi:hypothetical protein BLAT2472_170017 [Burkholderia latens]|uniref:hypothetical protein n=1 Tax=Burkholderia latens TaxID=488446 RepID=UPI0039A441BF